MEGAALAFKGKLRVISNYLSSGKSRKAIKSDDICDYKAQVCLSWFVSLRISLLLNHTFITCGQDTSRCLHFVKPRVNKYF